jgi:hypothetical protein
LKTRTHWQEHEKEREQEQRTGAGNDLPLIPAPVPFHAPATVRCYRSSRLPLVYGYSRSIPKFSRSVTDRDKASRNSENIQIAAAPGLPI